MKLWFLVHFNNGCMGSFVRDEASKHTRPDDNYYGGYLVLKTVKIKVTDIKSVSYEWKEEEQGSKG